MVLTKVFVGNLSFKTKTADLASEFTAAGKVVNANIITRGPRSLGYGFVEMENEDDAQKAVNLMNKKLVDNREINVELAKPRDESKVAERREASASSPATGDAPVRGGRGGFRGARGTGVRGGRGGVRGGIRGGRGGRGGFRGGRGGARPQGGDAVEGAAGAPPSGQSPVSGEARPVRRFRPRVQDNSQRTPSTNTLFVANLPFAITDSGLLDLFSGFKTKKAHVVLNRNGRSKGFGFVEFEDEASQKAALESVDKKSVEGRELIVKIALTFEPKTQSENKTEEKKEEKKEEVKTN